VKWTPPLVLEFSAFLDGMHQNLQVVGDALLPLAANVPMPATEWRPLLHGLSV